VNPRQHRELVRSPGDTAALFDHGVEFAVGNIASQPLLPEIGDLFDAIAKGREGAVGSRFSHESVMINYPFFKTLCNRTFHLLVKLLLVWRVHDISNNLKLYRTEVFRSIEIEERHFAANAELGLKPLLAGYDIEEVPISWINRTLEMGSSSFRIVKVAPRPGSERTCTVPPPGTASRALSRRLSATNRSFWAALFRDRSLPSTA
jgi:hypothetical protein